MDGRRLGGGARGDERTPLIKSRRTTGRNRFRSACILHIPFCRKRCKFCYFRVYTDKNATKSNSYVAALSREIELVSRLPVMGGRPFRFVYFGGGTPSFLSAKQLTSLVDRLRANINWDHAEEVTFECEPGTLAAAKVETLRSSASRGSAWASRTSATPSWKRTAGRTCRAKSTKSWDWIIDAGFPNINIDLISGMVGETWDNWQRYVRKTIELSPDSVTIYQMELPFNTVYSQGHSRQPVETPVADWPTKRAWVDYAFDELLAAGYAVSSAYTLVKDKNKVNFSYRDNLWRGSDLLATGVASFGHVSGCTIRTQPDWPHYVGRSKRGDCRCAADAADAASTAGARDDPAAQDRSARRGVLPRQVRRRNCRRLARRVAGVCRTKATSRSTATTSADPRRACYGPTACCRPSSSRSIRACGILERRG